MDILNPMNVKIMKTYIIKLDGYLGLYFCDNRNNGFDSSHKYKHTTTDRDKATRYTQVPDLWKKFPNRQWPGATVEEYGKTIDLFADLVDVSGSLIPKEYCTSAPLCPAVYVGRVDEVTDDGEVDVHMWSISGGQQSIATFTSDQLDRQPVHVGAALHIWTWLELPIVSTEPLRRIKIKVETKQISDDERTKLIYMMGHTSMNFEGQ